MPFCSKAEEAAGLCAILSAEMFATVLALMLLASSAAMPLSDRRVKVDLYIETLCPFCSGFMHNDVKDLLQSGLLEWADVTVVPSVRFLRGCGIKWILFTAVWQARRS